MRTICKKCGGDSWVLAETTCIGQDNMEVDVICNTTGCNEKKVMFIDISEGIEQK